MASGANCYTEVQIVVSKGWIFPTPTYPALCLTWSHQTQLGLALPYSEHLGPARGTYTLGCRSSILHSNGLAVLHFLLGAAFYAVRLHQVHLLLNTEQ